MANYKVFLNDGRTAYFTDVTASWVDVTVKSKPYRRQFGFVSVENGPGSGTESGVARTMVYDPSSAPANIDYTGTPSVNAAILIDDDMAGNASTVDSVSQTFRRYATGGGVNYDIPLWNFGGESPETDA